MKIEFEQLKYCVIIPGLQIPDEIAISIDGYYALYHNEHPPSPLFFFKKNYLNFDKDELDYYSSCFAFLHDQPTLIYEEESVENLPNPLFREELENEYALEKYYSDISMVYNAILDKKVNGSVLFFEEKALDAELDIDINYFKKVIKEISLYNSALKQIEPMVEFFMYCRVLESICNGLKDDWIRRTINKIMEFDFGTIYVFKNGEDIKDTNKVLYFDLLKSRFYDRIRYIERNHIDVGKYYIDEIRNSIAHGSTDVFEFKSLQKIEEDNIILKLLCRYGIMKKYQSGKEE